MAGYRRTSGANTAIANWRRRASAAWVALTIGRRRAGGAWTSLLANPLSVSPGLSLLSQASGSSGTFFEAFSATGGNGTYSWSMTSAPGVSMSSTTGANISLSWNPPSDQSRSFTLTCVSGGESVDVFCEWTRGTPI
ncbi:MAG TPA: hypothetical protein VFE72_02785 [Lysobacter sp.]|nr:hypothetical protein [Lysobacter sp.]